MILAFDRIVKGFAYPTMTTHQAEPYTPQWRQFGSVWPYSEPHMLVHYLDHDQVPYTMLTVDQAPDNAIYLLSLNFFDFYVDWFAIMDPVVLKRLRNNQLRMCIYYREGDNPQRMRQRIDQLAMEYNVNPELIWLVTANTAVSHEHNGIWFPEHEMLFRYRNRKITPCDYHEHPRTKLFTALVRTHKWWRCSIMSELWRLGYSEQGYFSYGKQECGDSPDDNPIEVDCFPGLRSSMENFLQYDFLADSLDHTQHNNHTQSVNEHYSNSYLNIVIETHMDADQSGGSFITEKTFKPIKNCQPFIVFGTAGTLRSLRNLGYRTFEGIIPTDYDDITNTTDRYRRIIQIIDDLLKQGHTGMHDLYVACKQDILHNQQHFLAAKQDRLNILLEKLS